MPASESAYFQLLCDAFHQAPVTQLVRQTLVLREAGVATLTLHPDERYHHGAGSIHGGILALVLDNAGWFASATMSEGHWLATAEFNVNLLEAVSAHEPIHATGRVLRKGRNLFHAQMEAATATGLKVAVGLGAYAVVPRKFEGYPAL